MAKPTSDLYLSWVVRDDSPPSAQSFAHLPLGGMHFGVKDIIDVAGFPTSYGVDFLTHQPVVDAWCVSALRAAGGIPIGKTHTTALAFRDPAVTRNPRDPARSPGGSSAGSAAAVGAGDVPFALGTQTLGSVERPAAYCGVVGYKPSWGRIPTVGMAPCAPSLDTIGIIAADVAIARRAAEALFSLEDRAPSSPRIGLALGYMTNIIEPETRSAIERAVARLRESGLSINDVALPASFEEAASYTARLQAAETWMSSGAWLAGKPVPEWVAKVLATGKAIDYAAYRSLRAWREAKRPEIAGIFNSVDAVIMPCANLAPEFGSTGDPTPLAPVTFFGLPAIAVPIGDDAATKLPFSMQIVAPAGADGRLLEIAARVEQGLAAPETVTAAGRS
jgi:Asp-tRNA(Asn)/Glu-tRNA(Gln) amidotransferase A subunit family amidase